ncbi:hypothetical protein MPTK1_7g04230 [Marchantia polymorpha subsp. ruderalis]|uniref:Uncharacterized protein n=2 Tax=Marchantia polymorpha TaxID=3197 RepID=A0AAF6BW07_MARPO|nr:hypothetical protein MARPO_0062s0102 [Marchantia polymorpha]BBN16191.1 hypothetical protein Mp_7g04230 [Marchantia polymorpha subsp. ruderalis]|eukprot:PTQ36691.1 hypothetical protein MARPO_0062s0102 [Marchantia polymorpha]
MEVARMCASASSSAVLRSASALSTKQMNGEAVRISMRTSDRLRTAPASSRPGSCRCLDVNWDPEGLLGRPEGPGLISRNLVMRKFKDETDKKVAMEKALKLEAEQRKAAREAREQPSTHSGLIEYFLMTDPVDMQFEISRCRPLLTDDFRRFLVSEIGTIRLALDKMTPEKELRLETLLTLQKTLEEGVVAHDKLTANISHAKENLVKILTSKDKKATLLELAGENKVNKGLLVLLDENIAAASYAGQDQMAEYMKKIREAMVKYITV